MVWTKAARVYYGILLNHDGWNMRVCDYLLRNHWVCFAIELRSNLETKPGNGQPWFFRRKTTSGLLDGWFCPHSWLNFPLKPPVIGDFHCHIWGPEAIYFHGNHWTRFAMASRRQLGGLQTWQQGFSTWLWASEFWDLPNSDCSWCFRQLHLQPFEAWVFLKCIHEQLDAVDMWPYIHLFLLAVCLQTPYEMQLT